MNKYSIYHVPALKSTCVQLIVNNYYYSVVRRKLDSLTVNVNIIYHPISLSMKLLKH